MQATHAGRETEKEETRVSWLVTCMEEPAPAFAPEAASDQEATWVQGVGSVWGLIIKVLRVGVSLRTAKGLGRPCLFLSVTMGSRTNVSKPPGFLSLPFSNRRSLRSKCGLFQTENRRMKQKLLPWKADPELHGHGGRASTNWPLGSASAPWPTCAAPGTRPGVRGPLPGDSTAPAGAGGGCQGRARG